MSIKHSGVYFIKFSQNLTYKYFCRINFCGGVTLHWSLLTRFKITRYSLQNLRQPNFTSAFTRVIFNYTKKIDHLSKKTSLSCRNYTRFPQSFIFFVFIVEWKTFLSSYRGWLCVFILSYTYSEESTLCNCLNVKELLIWRRPNIWNLSECNEIRRHNYLVHTQKLNWIWTLNHSTVTIT